MSLWSRIVNVFRGDRLSREIAEEFESHLAEAIEQGRDATEARGALGSALRQREESRDIRLIAWLDSLRADAVFGWRQLMKRKVTSAAAILSLAVGIGSCTSAFRLIDALLLRPLPVAKPERLYYCFHESILSGGKPRTLDGYEYPMFRELRETVKDQAELIAVSYTNRADLTYGSDQEMEKAYLQYVSGGMFGSFGLRPALGRLFTEDDDRKPGAHPYAVISYDYWTRRFGRDPNAVGHAFRMGSGIYRVIGVAEERFTGIEPGVLTDVFIPTMMNSAVTEPASSWVRILVRPKAGVTAEAVRDRMRAPFRRFREERAKTYGGISKERIDRYLNERLMLAPAAAGVSGMQRDYGQPLAVLGALADLVLLIACANAANLMTAQTAARAREMALRVAIGAGRRRLVQLVLVESVWLAFLASGMGAALAWWAAPFVAGRINPPDNPARLILPADWRVLGFGLGLALAVTCLFGLLPALRASAVKPAAALKGGADRYARRRLTHVLIAAQVAFCFVVLFLAGLFAATSGRLANQPMGFSAERILLLETAAERAQPVVLWDQIADRLRAFPGVEAAAIAAFPLFRGDANVGRSISVNGGPPSAKAAYFLNVSPGWTGVMRIPRTEGRDFQPGDTYPGEAIVNDAFVQEYFNGVSPLGKFFEKMEDHARFQIVGVVRNARYRNMREPFSPVAYVPFRAVNAKGALQPKRVGTFIVRTSSANPLALASILRREIPRARPEFRVTNIKTQDELVQAQTIRERLLAILAVFFAAVALLLAGIGLYGVLDYSVLQRRREIGICIAMGAQASGIARLVTMEVFLVVAAGAIAGLAAGMASARYVEALFYQVRATGLAMLAFPSLTVVGAALMASIPAVIHAVRIDPAAMLRGE